MVRPEKTKPGTEIERTCNDCGSSFTGISDESVAKGSSIREPGEAICKGCDSRRRLMVRQVKALPDTLTQRTSINRAGNPPDTPKRKRRVKDAADLSRTPG